jgi:hypothetical protein
MAQGNGTVDVALPPFRGRFTRAGTWTLKLTLVLETGHTLAWSWLKEVSDPPGGKTLVHSKKPV